MPSPARAVLDPRLRAVVVARQPLFYSDGADAATDRPAHVRAGSALARVGARLVVVQDDAAFLAVLEEDGTVRAVPLPYAPGGVRQFDEGRGNKAQKLDLEACTTLPDGRLLALGSGSSEVRDRAVLADLRGASDGLPTLRLVRLQALYAALHARHDLSGSRLNLEGAAVLPTLGVLRLFQRGNGEPRGGFLPLDATCDLPLDALLRYLDAPETVAPPTITDVVRWDLGALGDTRLTFTDACAAHERLFFLAAAEASPSAIDDGPVAGVVLGVMASLSAQTSARVAPLVDERGEPFRAKAEGLAFDLDDPTRALVVLDVDDAARPTELCTLRLDGPWREPA